MQCESVSSSQAGVPVCGMGLLKGAKGRTTMYFFFLGAGLALALAQVKIMRGHQRGITSHQRCTVHLKILVVAARQTSWSHTFFIYSLCLEIPFSFWHFGRIAGGYEYFNLGIFRVLVP